MFIHLCICFVCLNLKRFPFFSFKVEVYYLSMSSTRCSKLGTHQSAKCEYDFSPLIFLPIQLNNRAITLALVYQHATVIFVLCECIEISDNPEICCVARPLASVTGVYSHLLSLLSVCVYCMCVLRPVCSMIGCSLSSADRQMMHFFVMNHFEQLFTKHCSLIINSFTQHSP